MRYYDPYEARHSGMVPEYMPLTDYADYTYPDISPISLGQMSTNLFQDSAVPEVEAVSDQEYVETEQPILAAQRAQDVFFGPGVSGVDENTGEDYGENPAFDKGFQRSGTGTVGAEGAELSQEESGTDPWKTWEDTIEEPVATTKKEIPWLLIGAGVAVFLLLK